MINTLSSVEDAEHTLEPIDYVIANTYFFNLITLFYNIITKYLFLIKL